MRCPCSGPGEGGLSYTSSHPPKKLDQEARTTFITSYKSARALRARVEAECARLDTGTDGQRKQKPGAKYRDSSG